MNAEFKRLLSTAKWDESRVSYWVTKNEKLIRKTLTLDAKEQKKEIEEAGESPIYSYNQTDFVKERVAIEVQFGKYSLINRTRMTHIEGIYADFKPIFLFLIRVNPLNQI